MWRVGNRPLPKDITIDGGSDWIAINRRYAHYLITGNDELLGKIKRIFEFSLLPAEVGMATVVCSVIMGEAIYVLFTARCPVYYVLLLLMSLHPAVIIFLKELTRVLYSTVNCIMNIRV